MSLKNWRLWFWIVALSVMSLPFVISTDLARSIECGFITSPVIFNWLPMVVLFSAAMLGCCSFGFGCGVLIGLLPAVFFNYYRQMSPYVDVWFLGEIFYMMLLPGWCILERFVSMLNNISIYNPLSYMNTYLNFMTLYFSPFFYGISGYLLEKIIRRLYKFFYCPNLG